MTLSYNDAADQIDNLADAFEAIDRATDKFFPKLRIEDAEKLLAIRELDWINPTLIRRIRDVAEAIREDGDEHEALMLSADEGELRFVSR